MLEALIIILVIGWALGLFAFHVGGLIHVLLVIALIVLIVRLLQGRKILEPGKRQDDLAEGPSRKTDGGTPRWPVADYPLPLF